MTLAKQIQFKTPTEKLTAGASFLGKMDDGELLTSSPTAVEVDTSDLTITNVIINTVAGEIQDCAVLPGQAIYFVVEGGIAGKEYLIKCKGTTDALAANTPEVDVTLRVR